MTTANQSEQSKQASSIDIRSKGGFTMSGPDATNLFRVMTLKSSLKLYAKTGMIPTRGVTISVMLRMAEEITAKKYKRGEAMKAHDDLQVWCDEMRGAIPTTVDGVQQPPV